MPLASYRFDLPLTLFVGGAATFRATVRDQAGDIIDVSAATSKVLRFKDPSGAITEYDADLTTDGTDGQIQHRYDALPSAGEWRVQGRATLAGDVFSSQWHHFWVRE